MKTKRCFIDREGYETELLTWYENGHEIRSISIRGILHV